MIYIKEGRGIEPYAAQALAYFATGCLILNRGHLEVLAFDVQHQSDCSAATSLESDAWRKA